MNDTSVLTGLAPKHDFFIGIDSDGAVFDTMEIKHKECFIPNIIKHWKLQAVSKYAREAAEFVNLYSKFRGINRWPALIKAFELLDLHPDVQKRGVRSPKAESLRAWVADNTSWNNPALKAEIDRTGDAVLKQALAWSDAVNTAIEEMVEGVPPFPFLRESLERAGAKADMIVVSQTPFDALEREWKEHGIDGHVRVIAGQELGSKAEHLKMAAVGKYPNENILMIGDAPGDRKAAQANGVLFYPIIPGREDESWRRFHDEALDRFFHGAYAGDYQQTLVDAFEAVLPENPHWR